MRVRAFMSGAAAVALAAGAMAAGAGPVAAAELSEACSEFDVWDGYAEISDDYTAGGDGGFIAGEVLTIGVRVAGGTVSEVVLEVPVLSPVASLTTFPGSLVFAIPAALAGGDFWGYRIDTVGAGVIEVDPSCAAAPESRNGDPIPAWVQAYGRVGGDAACLDGWDPSWQEWAEPVTGGWVCTRSIPSLG